jgi:hypothetical protein
VNGYEIGQYKEIIIRKLLGDPELVDLLNVDGQAEYPDDLIYQNIFPFARMPDTEQETKAYITVSVNVERLDSRNDMVRRMRIVIRIFSHADLMRVSGQSMDRIDLMAARVDKLLNETQDIGIGYVVLVSNAEHVLDTKHSYRELIFRTDDINSKRDGAARWS